MRSSLSVVAACAALSLAACGQATTSNTSATGSASGSSGSTASAPMGTAAAEPVVNANGCTTGVKPAATTAAQSDAAPVAAPAGTALARVVASGPADGSASPKLTFASLPVKVTEVTKAEVTPGTGTPATRESQVTARTMIYHGTSGKMLDDGYAKGREPEAFQLNRADLLPGLTAGLVGATKGERFVFAIPPKDAFGSAGRSDLGITGTDTLVVLVDIVDVKTVPSHIDGTMTAAPATLPVVTFPNGTTNAPMLTVPKAAPTKTEQATLIEGSGEVVKKGDTITAHYHGVQWNDCSVFDSSWERGAPAEFEIGTGKVIKGWDDTLVGKKVGSRVLLAIAPADGYGASEQAPDNMKKNVLIFVVDILATRSAAPATSTTAP